MDCVNHSLHKRRVILHATVPPLGGACNTTWLCLRAALTLCSSDVVKLSSAVSTCLEMAGIFVQPKHVHASASHILVQVDIAQIVIAVRPLTAQLLGSYLLTVVIAHPVQSAVWLPTVQVAPAQGRSLWCARPASSQIYEH